MRMKLVAMMIGRVRGSAMVAWERRIFIGEQYPTWQGRFETWVVILTPAQTARGMIRGPSVRGGQSGSDDHLLTLHTPHLPSSRPLGVTTVPRLPRIGTVLCKSTLDRMSDVVGRYAKASTAPLSLLDHSFFHQKRPRLALPLFFNAKPRSKRYPLLMHFRLQL
jgi:hypothetical protein